MYILKCANGSYYTGSTTDLEMRVEEHRNGLGANFTRKHLPVELVYAEEFSRIEDAFCREKQIQGWTRKKKEALIAGNFDKLKEFAKAGSTGSPSGVWCHVDSFPELVEGNICWLIVGSTGSPSGRWVEYRSVS